MTRREFLKDLAQYGARLASYGAVAALYLGAKKADAATIVRVKINAPNGTRTVKISTGCTVRNAIRAAFAYAETPNGTIINGIRGSWKYRVNGVMPSAHAGNYRLGTSCTIDLKLI